MLSFLLIFVSILKRVITIFLLNLLLIFTHSALQAQCSICTKTAQQLGEKPALGLNSGILYLMFTPFLIVGFIGYRWWKNNREQENSGEI